MLPKETSARRLAVAAGLIALLAVAVRLPGALGYALWQDEVASARALDEPGPLSLLRHVARDESTPPAWYAAAWLGHQAGLPIEWLRALSVLAAGALSGLTVVYARRFVGLVEASLAGALVALGWQLVMHGWELRAYELLALASLAFVIALEAAVERPTRRRLAVLGALVAVGSMTHYFFLFTLAAGVAWLALERSRVPLRRIAVAIGVGLVPLVLWLPAFAVQYRNDRFSWIGPFRLEAVSDVYAYLFARGLPHGARMASAVLVLGVVIAGAVALWRRSAGGRLCVLVCLGPVALAALAWLAGAHIFVTRNLIGTAPFAATAIAAATGFVPGRARVVAVAAVAALAVLGYQQAYQPSPPPYDRVADALVAQGWSADTPILLFGSRYGYLHPLGWYLPGRPELSPAARRAGSCRQAVIVAVGGRARSLTDAAPSRTRVGRIVVARVDWDPSLWRTTTSRGGTVIAVQAHPPPCSRVTS